MKFYIVDAFTDTLFGGNTAGVVILDSGQDFPPEGIMIKTAAELKYSETAFVRKIGEKRFHIRYFTPAAEVDLCGHATIGSFGALMACGLVSVRDAYELDTLAGKLEVVMQDGFILMDMATPAAIAEITEDDKLAELADVMGISVSDIGLTPQMVSTGLPDIMLHIKTRDALKRIKPDFSALAALSKRYDVVGVHAFALADEPGVKAYCRNFAPLYDIDEEAATGTSNGALTYYLYKNGYVTEGETNIFCQGESMNRPSKIMSLLTEKDGSVQVKVGGTYVTLACGEIFIPAKQ